MVEKKPVIDNVVNSLEEWQERDKKEVLNLLEDVELSLTNLRNKIKHNSELFDSDSDNLHINASKVREKFLKLRDTYKALRMVKYHINEEKKSQ
jgi:hypothetical protein